jgi:hypothetical protein
VKLFAVAYSTIMVTVPSSAFLGVTGRRLSGSWKLLSPGIFSFILRLKGLSKSEKNRLPLV